MTDNDTKYQENLLLTQHYRRFDAIMSANTALDTKATTLLGSSSLIVSLFGSVGLFRLATTSAGTSLRGLVVLLIVFFIGMVVTIALAWRPRASLLPGSGEWLEMRKRLLDAKPHEAFMAALSDSIAATEDVAKINRYKGKMVQVAFALFVAELLILVLLLVSLAPPSAP
jgi:hypothetical protein